MGKKAKRLLALKAKDPDPASNEPCGFVDLGIPPEPAPEELCEAAESVVAEQREICAPAVEEIRDDLDPSSESDCEVAEHAVIEQSDDDADMPTARSPGNCENDHARSR